MVKDFGFGFWFSEQSYHRGAGDGSGASQDEAADVSDDFDHDKPPRVVDFQFG